ARPGRSEPSARRRSIRFRTLRSQAMHGIPIRIPKRCGRSEPVAGADEVPVTVPVVYFRYVGEELGPRYPFERIGGLHPRIGMVPLPGHFEGGMRRIHHHIVLVVVYRLAFALDADERFDEAVHLFL